jgi:hypothetical protein
MCIRVQIIPHAQVMQLIFLDKHFLSCHDFSCIFLDGRVSLSHRRFNISNKAARL